MQRLPITGNYPVVRNFYKLIDLYINTDTNIRFQFNGDAVIPDGYLLDTASYQRLVKFGEVGSLLCDVILQVIDLLYLFISCDRAIIFSSMFSSEVACEARMTEAMFSCSCA